MPLDRRAQRLLDMLAAGGTNANPKPSAADRRQALSNLAQIADDDTEIVAGVETRTVPGPAGLIKVRVYSPIGAGRELLTGLIFFHGGGWVAGGFDTHDGLCRRLANQTGCRVIAVDYRLAPEHPFPAPLEDCLAASTWIADHATSFGVDADRLAVGGDSAGGGLAAAVCQDARETGRIKVVLQLLICPILDLEEATASRQAFAEGYFLTRAAMTQDVDDYCPAGLDRTDRRLSPGRADDLTGLPATIIHVAEFDPFRDEGEAYALRLSQSGTVVKCVRHPGMIHYFYALARAVPYALVATRAIGEDVRAILDAATA